MGFTANTTAALQQRQIAASLSVELKTNFTESNSWLAFDHAPGSLKITKERGKTWTFQAKLVNRDLALAVERSKTNRCQLFGQLRVKATVGGESEYIILGRLHKVDVSRMTVTVSGPCKRHQVLRARCEVDVPTTHAEVVDDATKRQVYELSQLPGVYVLSPDGSGTDPAFSEADQTVRRSWHTTNLRIWRHDGSDYEEVASGHRMIDWTNGSVQILEDTTGYTYHVSNCTAVKESAASGANQVDYADVLEAALTYAGAGGLAMTASDYDLSAIGIDLSGDLYYKGTIHELLAMMQERSGKNIDIIVNPETGKVELKRYTQKAAGSTDYTLYNPKSISQPRSVRDIASLVIATGYNSQPVNILANNTAGLADQQTDDQQWFKWSGPDTDNDSFANVRRFCCDGDAMTGIGVCKLDAASNAERYTTWYNLIEYTHSEVAHIDRIRVRMPPSFHKDHASYRQLDAAWLHPGVQVLAKVNPGDDYVPVAPALDKVRYRPTELVDVLKDQITQKRFQYLMFVAGAYKHGNYNYKDPSCGFMEIEIFTEERFEEELSIYHSNHAVTAVSTGSKTFTIAGEWEDDFTAGDSIEITGSTGNDGLYTIAARTESGGNTIITVSEAVPSATADGYLAPVYLYSDHTSTNPHYWNRACPDLATRLGADPTTRQGLIHVPRTRDTEKRLPRPLARDAAIQDLSESVRLFESVTYVSVCDPRINPGDSVAIDDNLGGDIDTAMADRVEVIDRGTTVYATNYRATALENS